MQFVPWAGRPALKVHGKSSVHQFCLTAPRSFIGVVLNQRSLNQIADELRNRTPCVYRPMLQAEHEIPREGKGEISGASIAHVYQCITIARASQEKEPGWARGLLSEW